MRANGAHAFSPLLNKGISSFARGAGGISQVIDQYDVPVCHISNDCHPGYFISPSPVFIANDKVTFEMVGVVASPFNTSYIRRRKNGGLPVKPFQIWNEDGVAF